jgi:hypothetical protein
MQLRGRFWIVYKEHNFSYIRNSEVSLMVAIVLPILVLQVTLSKDSKEPFLALLQQYSVAHEEMMLKANVLMGLSFVDIVKDAGPWANALAMVIWAYLEKCRSRKVIITTKDNTVVHCEGLSQSEIESVLRHAESMTAIETQQDEI